MQCLRSARQAPHLARPEAGPENRGRVRRQPPTRNTIQPTATSPSSACSSGWRGIDGGICRTRLDEAREEAPRTTRGRHRRPRARGRLREGAHQPRHQAAHRRSFRLWRPVAAEGHARHLRVIAVRTTGSRSQNVDHDMTTFIRLRICRATAPRRPDRFGVGEV